MAKISGMKQIQKLTHFLHDTVWQEEWAKVSKTRGRIAQVIRILYLTVRNFNKNHSIDKAQSLTFYTVLSIVPLLAMVFGIAKGFGMENNLRTELQKAFTGQDEVYNWLMNFVENMLNNTQGGTIAGFGLLFLFWSVINLISKTESTFNGIWHVRTSRSWKRKFTDYFSIMLLAPILIIMSSSATIFLETQADHIFDSLQILSFMKPIVMFGIGLIPYMLVWLSFSFVYMLIPNTKVNFKSALVAGIVAGSSFQLLEWGYVNSQIGVSKYNAIYGSFAALPLFLLWLNLSWQILLTGAELSYSHASLKNYLHKRLQTQVNPRTQELILFHVLCVLVQEFRQHDKLMTRNDLHQQLINTPNELIDKAVNRLTEANILHTGEDYVLLPAIDINKLDFNFILNKLQHTGGTDSTELHSPELQKFKAVFDAFDSQRAENQMNVPLKDFTL